MEVVLGLHELLHHSVSALQSTHFTFQLPLLLLVLQFFNLIQSLLDGLLKLRLLTFQSDLSEEQERLQV